MIQEWSIPSDTCSSLLEFFQLNLASQNCQRIFTFSGLCREKGNPCEDLVKIVENDSFIEISLKKSNRGATLLNNALPRKGMGFDDFFHEVIFSP
jgi:hypothetical protein